MIVVKELEVSVVDVGPTSDISSTCDAPVAAEHLSAFPALNALSQAGVLDKFVDEVPDVPFQPVVLRSN
jgi:hypothetical protein